MPAHLRPHPDVLARRVGDDIVLVHMGQNHIFSLNSTGARLWELLSDGCSPAQAIEQLGNEFDAPQDVIAREVDRLVDGLARNGLIVSGETP